MKTLLLVSYLLLFSLYKSVSADTNPLVTAYNIPAGAVKQGPLPSRDPSEKLYAYLSPGAEVKQENVIGYEMFYGGVLVKRDLFQAGKRYGVQREWYRNGQLKSESPYNMNRMDGTFKQWNEKGQLIAQYEMKDGAGVRRVYNDAGILVKEEQFQNNLNNGYRMELVEPEYIRSIVPFKDGRRVAQAFSFYAGDNVRGISFFIFSDNDADVNAGFRITFDEKGNVQEKRWHLRFQLVSEAEYAKAAATDTKLPPYYADTQRYKEFITSGLKAMLNKYRTLPSVKIPLELNAQGSPILATQVP